jgi:pimeloyl-ACP methyl ester carboxylesterase
VVDYDRGVELAASISGARLHTLEGAGHNFTTEATEEANGAVLDFLAGLAVGSDS